MPTNFDKEFQSVDMSKTETQTVSVDYDEAQTEKFDTTKWIIAVTSILNTHVNKIANLEKQVKFLHLVVSALVAWEIYRVL